MHRQKIKELIKLEISEPKEAVVKGWIRTKRESKKLTFLAVSDGSCPATLQIVIKEDFPNYAEIIKQLSSGTSLMITGDLVKSKGAEQPVEMVAKEIQIYGLCDALEYPLQKKELTYEYLREIAHLRPRTATFGAVFRMRHSMAFAIHKFFNDKGFYYIHTPIITGSDCEGAGEMFKVTTLPLEAIPKTKDGKVDFDKDFFGKETNLTVSGQLEGELFALALGEIYTFGPTFRAENSNTSRHASEFWMIEPEMAFCELPELMNLEEEFVKYLIKYAFDHCADELEFFDKNIEGGLIERLRMVLETEFERVTYRDAVKILEEAEASGAVKFEVTPSWQVEIATEHERYLTEKHFKKPIILHNFPREFKAFYMFQNEDGTVRGTDVLVPRIGEILGGSEREWRLDRLTGRIKELGLSEQDYWWYVDTRKFGSVPHAGFGLGFERLLMFITGMQNIRDVCAFPRTPRNSEF